MTCPKCGSTDVTIQMVTDYDMKNKHHGIIWWICVGCWWVPLKWILFTIPALIVKIFKPKRQKIKTTTRKMCVCQTCGHSWEIA